MNYTKDVFRLIKRAIVAIQLNSNTRYDIAMKDEHGPLFAELIAHRRFV